MGFKDRLQHRLQDLTQQARARVLPDIWTQPEAGRPIMAVVGTTTVRGYQTADGQVIVTSVEHMGRHPQSGVSDDIRQRHYVFVMQAREEVTGEYTWQGRTEPHPPTHDLSAIMGMPVENVWREEARSWTR